MYKNFSNISLRLKCSEKHIFYFWKQTFYFFLFLQWFDFVWLISHFYCSIKIWNLHNISPNYFRVRLESKNLCRFPFWLSKLISLRMLTEIIFTKLENINYCSHFLLFYSFYHNFMLCFEKTWMKKNWISQSSNKYKNLQLWVVGWFSCLWKVLFITTRFRDHCSGSVGKVLAFMALWWRSRVRILGCLSRFFGDIWRRASEFFHYTLLTYFTNHYTFQGNFPIFI